MSAGPPTTTLKVTCSCGASQATTTYSLALAQRAAESFHAVHAACRPPVVQEEHA